MTSILETFAHGRDLPPGPIQTTDVVDIAVQLDQRLGAYGYTWSQVSLLIVINSKRVTPDDTSNIAEDTVLAMQRQSDENLVGGLQRFATAKGHVPPLMGTTAKSMFFSDRGDYDTDISDGILLIAMISAVLPTIPVAMEISGRRGDRKVAGSFAVRKCTAAFRAEIKRIYGRAERAFDIHRHSTGLLFTSGSGHIGARQFIDFVDCYAVGQELIVEAEEAEIVGGCSTNRHSHQLQALYFLKTDRGDDVYAYTYDHAAVFAFLPYVAADHLLQHPFDVARPEPLNLTFNPTDKHDDGRFFYIERINGQAPIDFLVEYWDVTRDELLEMCAKHTPIPAQQKTFQYTFASALHPNAPAIWPNVPVWFNEVDGQILLRLVRAEAEQSPYYLMVMRKHGIRENAITLGTFFDTRVGSDATVLSFLCESRKYLLEAEDSNVEAETILGSMHDASVKIGIYLNGEYAVGMQKSIGYHNFSHVTAIAPTRDAATLPNDIYEMVVERFREPAR